MKQKSNENNNKKRLVRNKIIANQSLRFEMAKFSCWAQLATWNIHWQENGMRIRWGGIDFNMKCTGNDLVIIYFWIILSSSRTLKCWSFSKFDRRAHENLRTKALAKLAYFPSTLERSTSQRKCSAFASETVFFHRFSLSSYFGQLTNIYCFYNWPIRFRFTWHATHAYNKQSISDEWKRTCSFPHNYDNVIGQELICKIYLFKIHRDSGERENVEKIEMLLSYVNAFELLILSLL